MRPEPTSVAHRPTIQDAVQSGNPEKAYLDLSFDLSSDQGDPMHSQVISSGVGRRTNGVHRRLFGVMQIITSAVLAIGIAALPSALPASANTATVWKNSDVTAVSVGGSHTCAIETGVLFCWGAGTSGQLGYLPPPRPPVLPSPTDQSKAVRVTPASGFTNTNVSAVSTGGSTTCAIENKVLYCWGANSSGQVGNGRNT